MRRFTDSQIQLYLKIAADVVEEQQPAIEHALAVARRVVEVADSLVSVGNMDGAAHAAEIAGLVLARVRMRVEELSAEVADVETAARERVGSARETIG